jgi:hypothetical protein
MRTFEHARFLPVVEHSCRLLVFFSLLLVCPPLLTSQTAIRGIVVDEITGASIPSASLSLRHTSHKTIAGPDGTFELPRVAPGTYVLEIAHVHYKRRFHVFTIEQEPHIYFRIELEPQSNTLPLTSRARGTSSATIRGRIVDQESHEPIPLANVIIRNTRYGAATDSAGIFEIQGLPPDLYAVEFRHVAYKTRIHVLSLEQHQTVTMDVEMEQEPIPLSEVTVSGVPFEPNKVHQTFASTVITHEQIARMGARTLSDILRSFEPGSMPGFSPRGSRRISNLERVPFMIFLDGMYVAYVAGAMDNIIDVQQIERIEIARWVGVAPNFGPGTSDRVLQIFSKKPK